MRGDNFQSAISALMKWPGSVVSTKTAEIMPQAIARIKAYVDRSTAIDFKILDSWTRGSVVVNERIDAFTRAEGNVAYHLTGVFVVKDGKIVEWSDYSIR